MVHLLCVGQSQSHVHGVSLACKFKGTGMLAVAPVIERSFGSFGFLNVQRTDRNPAYTLAVIVVVRLVDILSVQRKNKHIKAHVK